VNEFLFVVIFEVVFDLLFLDSRYIVFMLLFWKIIL